MTDNRDNFMSIAPGVVDRVISIAACEVEGVSKVSIYTSGGLVSNLITKAKRQAILTHIDENGNLCVGVHVIVEYGYSIPKLAAEIRQHIADALFLQLGIEVGEVNIFVESVAFAKAS